VSFFSDATREVLQAWGYVSDGVSWTRASDGAIVNEQALDQLMNDVPSLLRSTMMERIKAGGTVEVEVSRPTAKTLLIRLGRARLERDFLCAECGEKTRDDYMARDDVWTSVAGKRDVLHLECFAKRLGRTLAPEDFPAAIISNRAVRFLLGGGKKEAEHADGH
jgi:hypothetical protein